MAQPRNIDPTHLRHLRELAAALPADPEAAKEDPEYVAFAEGVSATLGWLLGEDPHPGLADLLELE